MSGLKYLLDTSFLLCVGEQQLAAVVCRGGGQLNSHSRHRTRARTGGGAAIFRLIAACGAVNNLRMRRMRPIISA